MKKMISVILIVALFVIGVGTVQAGYKEDVKALRDLKSEVELTHGKEVNIEEPSATLAVVSGGIGIWGIVAYAGTGSIYTLVTGIMFISAGYKELQRVANED
jgi:N-acetylglucosamine kinase-like BadF-type ATPase